MAYYDKKPAVDPIKALKDRIETDFVGGYLFWGEEEYLKNYYREALKKKIRDTGMAEFNLVSVEFERGANLSDVSDSIDTPPVMSPYKLIEITGLDILSLKKDEEKLLVEAIERRADDTVVILNFHFDELDLSTKKVKERKIVKDLSEHLFTVEFPRQKREKLLSWTDKIFTSESLHISDVNIGRMIDLCDYSMTRLKSESDKLVCRAKMEEVYEIPNDWINLMVKPSAENEIYDLSDAVAFRDGARASDILENIIAQNFDPIEVLSAIVKSVVTIATILSAREKGKRPEPASVGLLWDWQLEKYNKCLSSRTMKGLEKSIKACVECDRALKGESTNKTLALSILVATLVSEECK